MQGKHEYYVCLLNAVLALANPENYLRLSNRTCEGNDFFKEGTKAANVLATIS